MIGTMRQKIVLSMTLVAGLALLICLLPLAWLMQNSYLQQLEFTSQAQARMLADMSTASLLFQQPESANDILNALSESPDIQAASLFQQEHGQLQLFAYYQQATEPNQLPLQLDAAGKYLSADHLHLLTPVQLHDQRLGMLYLKVSLARIQQDFQQGILIVGSALLLALLVTLWLARSLSRNLLSPIAQLKHTTTTVATTKDYSQRVQQKFAAELGELVDSFNAMLEVIEEYNRQQQAHEKQITSLNLELEQRVTQRTQELTDSLNNLKNTQLKLVEQEKLASLGSLVAGVAHEINTPVGVAVTAVSHLRYALDRSQQALEAGTLTKKGLLQLYQEQKESTDIIYRNLERAAEQVRSFKRVAVDQSSEEARTFVLQDYLQDIILSLKPRLKRTQHQIRLDIPAGLQLHSFPGCFSQIFTNFLMNSLIHGFTDTNEGQIDIDVDCQDEHLVIDYYDNGKGVSPEMKARIFDPFVTSNRQHGGSGLGTYIVYNIVTQALHGDIQLLDDRPQGVHFRIKLPRSELQISFLPDMQAC